jgi:hypothetical protein
MESAEITYTTPRLVKGKNVELTPKAALSQRDS